LASPHDVSNFFLLLIFLAYTCALTRSILLGFVEKICRLGH
jgi:hypothetical protein